MWAGKTSIVWLLGTELAEEWDGTTPRLSRGPESKGEGNKVMKELKRILTVVFMAAILSVTALCPASAFGQKGNSNRPPKEQPKIKEKDKPPPSNSNTNRGRGKP